MYELESTRSIEEVVAVEEVYGLVVVGDIGDPQKGLVAHDPDFIVFLLQNTQSTHLLLSTTPITRDLLSLFSTMADAPLGIAETIQSASLKRNPSPFHDINPSTATSEKLPVVDHAPSDTESISSDVVDPRHMVRSVPRRQTLPPLPDLRFEQSYLASIRGADTWGRVAWITIRDQVRQTSLHHQLWAN